MSHTQAEPIPPELDHDEHIAGSSSNSHTVEGPSQPSPHDLTSRNEDMDSGNIEGNTVSLMGQGSGRVDPVSHTQAESIPPEFDPDKHNVTTNVHPTSSEDSREHQKMAPRPKRTLHQEALRTRMKRSRKRVKPYVCHICHTVVWGQFERYRMHIQLHLTCNFGSRKKPVKDGAEKELGTSSSAKMSTEEGTLGSSEAAAKMHQKPIETCTSTENNMVKIQSVVQSTQNDEKTVEPIKIKTEADEDEIVNVPIPSMYRCGKCDAGFNTVLDLVFHVEKCTGVSVGSQSVMNMKAKSKSPKKKKKKHKTDRLHKCVACKKTFKDVESLAHHISKKHDGKVKSDAYKCAVCEKAFKDEGALQSHIQKNVALEHHKWKKHIEKTAPFPCKLCGKTFSLQSSLNRHMPMHRRQMPMHRRLHSCERCNKQFTQKTRIRMHKCPTPCKVCKKLFPTPLRAKTHERNVHCETKDFKCPRCSKCFATASHMKEHMKGTHGLATHLCHQCGKSFSHKRSYRRHVQSHANAGIKPFTCEICGMSFVQDRSLKNHITNMHSNLEKVPCEFCGRKLKTEEYRKLHVRKYHSDGDKSYKCYVCSEEFPNKEDLSKHMDESDEKCKTRPDLVCKVCGKRCPKPFHLARHMRSHTGERPFVCTICGKAYSTNYTLLCHSKLHDDPRPYTCQICGRGYGSRTYLNQHVKKFHNGQKNPEVPQDWSKKNGIRCVPCKIVFKKDKYLKLHMKRKHPDMVEQVLPTRTQQSTSASVAENKKPAVKASTFTQVKNKTQAQKVIQDMPQNLVVRQMPQNLAVQEVPQNLVIYPTRDPTGTGTSESLNRVPIPLAVHSSAPLQTSVGVPVQLQSPQDQHHAHGQQEQKPDEAGRNVIEESMRLITVNWW